MTPEPIQSEAERIKYTVEHTTDPEAIIVRAGCGCVYYQYPISSSVLEPCNGDMCQFSWEAAADAARSLNDEQTS